MRSCLLGGAAVAALGGGHTNTHTSTQPQHYTAQRQCNATQGHSLSLHRAEQQEKTEPAHPPGSTHVACITSQPPPTPSPPPSLPPTITPNPSEEPARTKFCRARWKSAPQAEMAAKSAAAAESASPRHAATASLAAPRSACTLPSMVTPRERADAAAASISRDPTRRFTSRGWICRRGGSKGSTELSGRWQTTASSSIHNDNNDSNSSSSNNKTPLDCAQLAGKAPVPRCRTC